MNTRPRCGTSRRVTALRISRWPRASPNPSIRPVRPRPSPRGSTGSPTPPTCRTADGLVPFGWFAGQDEPDARAGLLVDGFREAAEFHLIKDALDALAQFLADPQ